MTFFLEEKCNYEQRAYGLCPEGKDLFFKEIGVSPRNLSWGSGEALLGKDPYKQGAPSREEETSNTEVQARILVAAWSPVSSTSQLITSCPLSPCAETCHLPSVQASPEQHPGPGDEETRGRQHSLWGSEHLPALPTCLGVSLLVKAPSSTKYFLRRKVLVWDD